MRNRRRLATVLVGTIAVCGLVACGGGGGTGQLPGALKATKDLRFSPNTVNVRFNRETIFTFQNTDKRRTHNFTLSYVFTDADNFVSVDAKPGETQEVKFVVKDRPAAGYLTYYCKYFQNEGMSGRIKLI